MIHYPVGHDDIIRAFHADWRAQRLPHAHLFVGPRGCGKATTAQFLAGQLLEFGEFPPSDIHELPQNNLVRRMEAGSEARYVDLNIDHLREQHGDTRMITVDMIRERLGRLFVHAADPGTRRVCILDPAELMNQSAANALLKILEEPPPFTSFFLITQQPGALLKTILSRVHNVQFSPLSQTQVKEVLNNLQLFEEFSEDWNVLSASQPGEFLWLAQHFGTYAFQLCQRIVTKSANPHELLQEDLDYLQNLQKDKTLESINVFFHCLRHMLHKYAMEAIATDDRERALRLAKVHEDVEVVADNMKKFNLDRRRSALRVLMDIYDRS